MDYRKIGIGFSICIIIIIGILIVYPARNTTSIHPILDVYGYPNSEVWKNLDSQAEKIEALQISEDVLVDMSDEGLIETILHFPLFHMEAYNTLEDAYHHLYMQCNGVHELLSRESAGSALLKAYEMEEEKTRTAILELLVNRPEVQNSLSDKEKEYFEESKQRKAKLEGI